MNVAAKEHIDCALATQDIPLLCTAARMAQRWAPSRHEHVKDQIRRSIQQMVNATGVDRNELQNLSVC